MNKNGSVNKKQVKGLYYEIRKQLSSRLITSMSIAFPAVAFLVLAYYTKGEERWKDVVNTMFYLGLCFLVISFIYAIWAGTQCEIKEQQLDGFDGELSEVKIRIMLNLEE